MPRSPGPPSNSPRAFDYPPFTLFAAARFLVTFSALIVSVAVGWQVYDLTRSPFDLGLVGLVQFAPALLLVLVTGAAADRFPRRVIVAVCQAVEGISAVALLVMTYSGAITVGAIFAVLAVFGVARAFVNPAAQSLLPNLVPPEALANAIAISSSSWQLATILGPVAGGLLYGVSPTGAYGVAAAFFFVASVLVAFVPRPPQKGLSERVTWSAVIAGFRFIWSEKVVFGAISMDLFAVLLGGVVALLPAYAHDILDAGPWGLGLLRSAMGIGAVLTAIVLTWRPIADRAGIYMFAGVAVFGVANLVFGVSNLVWLSILALAAAGAADMVSVYVRETLIQLWTPDEVRGRVSAVNMVFIGASNELGEFRAGSVAALIGVVPAVVLGGIGSVIVAGLWSWGFPGLRRIRHLRGRDAPPPAAR